MVRNICVSFQLKQQSSTDSKVSQMFELAFNSKSEDNEKKIQAAKNLIVLAREEAGAEKVYQNNGIPQLINLLEKSKDVTLQVTALRVMACLANNSRTRVSQSCYRLMGYSVKITLFKCCYFCGVS